MSFRWCPDVSTDSYSVQGTIKTLVLANLNLDHKAHSQLKELSGIEDTVGINAFS